MREMRDSCTSGEKEINDQSSSCDLLEVGQRDVSDSEIWLVSGVYVRPRNTHFTVSSIISIITLQRPPIGCWFKIVFYFLQKNNWLQYDNFLYVFLKNNMCYDYHSISILYEPCSYNISLFVKQRLPVVPLLQTLDMIHHKTLGRASHYNSRWLEIKRNFFKNLLQVKD